MMNSLTMEALNPTTQGEDIYRCLPHLWIVHTLKEQMLEIEVSKVSQKITFKRMKNDSGWKITMYIIKIKY